MGVAASRQEAFWEACGFGHKERVKKFLECGDIDVNYYLKYIRFTGSITCCLVKFHFRLSNHQLTVTLQIQYS
jgi:hypothetical protein